MDGANLQGCHLRGSTKALAQFDHIGPSCVALLKKMMNTRFCWLANWPSLFAKNAHKLINSSQEHPWSLHIFHLHSSNSNVLSLCHPALWKTRKHKQTGMKAWRHGRMSYSKGTKQMWCFWGPLSPLGNSFAVPVPARWKIRINAQLLTEQSAEASNSPRTLTTKIGRKQFLSMIIYWISECTLVYFHMDV